MVKFMFSVFDSKAQAYGNPFYSPRQDLAIRDFVAAARDASSIISKFPEDFQLVEIGEYDDAVCTFCLHDKPIPLGLASQLMES